MAWVYILNNKVTDRYYIGSTIDLKRRLKEHIKGKTRTTKILQTFELVYKEFYNTVADARSREKKLKSYKSKRYLKWLINGSVAQG